jgi:DNA invertase Pin-like site-specific DNA recombinase
MVVQKTTTEGNKKPRFLFTFERKALQKAKKMTNEAHIGRFIKEELKRQGRSVSWLARNLHCSRQNIYRLFEHQYIYTDTLLKLSDLLGYDFFKWYSDYWQNSKCNE